MKSKILIKDYLKLNTLSDIQVNSEYVAWVEKKPHSITKGYKSHIKVLNRKSGKIIQYTSGNKSDFSPRFSPDGKNLAFLSSRNDKTQIFTMNLSGGEALPITNNKLGISSFSWSENSKNILYLATTDLKNINEKDKDIFTEFESKMKDEREKELERKRWDPVVINNLIYRTGTDLIDEGRYKQLFVINLLSEEIIRITEGEFNFGMGKWLDEYNILTFVKKEEPVDLSEISTLLKIDIRDKSVETIIDTYNPFIFTPDIVVNKYDHSLIMHTVTEKIFDIAVVSQLNKYQAVGGKIINKEFDRSISQIKWISERKAYVLVNHHGYQIIQLYDFDTDEFKTLYDPSISISSYDVDDDIYVIASDTEHPYAVYKLENKEFKLVYDPNTKLLETKDIIKPECIWFENIDGIKYQGWFFDASNGENKPPLILSTHGGPHVMWTETGMWHEWQMQVSAGYSVLALNTLGSDGYGEEFLRKIVGNWGIEDGRDQLQAVDEISDRIDKNRIYVTGGSYAGFLVAHLISIDHRFKAACSQRGVYDFRTLDAGSDLPRFGELEYTGDMFTARDYLWEQSPLSKVKDVKTPLLIIHSERDFRVPISQAEIYFSALRTFGKEVQFVRYPDEGHELSRSGQPMHVIDRLERMMNWFDNHTH